MSPIRCTINGNTAAAGHSLVHTSVNCKNFILPHYTSRALPISFTQCRAKFASYTQRSTLCQVAFFFFYIERTRACTFS